MVKLSSAMDLALDELKLVADYKYVVNDGWRPALICLSARESTFDALVRRGLAEVKIDTMRGFPSLSQKVYRLLGVDHIGKESFSFQY